MEIAIEIYYITLVYIFNTREDITEEELKEALPEGGEPMATLAKQLFHKGEEKGIVKGIEKGKEETAINLYKMGLTLDQIAQGTRLDKETLREILKEVER
ncbi:MAG: hypothetical protein U9N62_08185 [Thermotogota bacterium]|nr:hypothetical protein [Thermotogota bacterium]